MMDPGREDWRAVLDKLRLLKDSWPNPTWTWDDRFTMMASSFTQDRELEARSSAAHAFPYAWDVKTVRTAPAGLVAICDRSGGLRAGQRLLAGKAGPVVLVGLWWPWNGGATTTLRIGLGEYEAMEPPFPEVRTMFGVRS